MRKCHETKSPVKIFSKPVGNKLSVHSVSERNHEWTEWVGVWGRVTVYFCVCEPTTSAQLTVLHRVIHLQWHSGTCPPLRQEAMTLDRKWVTNNNWSKIPYKSFIKRSFIKRWLTLSQRLSYYSYFWRDIFQCCLLYSSQDRLNMFAYMYAQQCLFMHTV